MIVDVLDLIDTELRENGYDDSTITEGCKEGNGPVGVVFVAQGNLIAWFDAQPTEQLMETGNHLGRVAIRVTLAGAVVGDARAIPVLLERVLHHADDGGVGRLEYSCCCFSQNVILFEVNVR